MISYFDSSILLSIMLDEDTKNESYAFWKNAEIRASSILLKIEATIVVRRTFEHFKYKLSPDWLTKKMAELDEYLNEVTYRIVDEEIEQSISLKKDLSKCRALDAIHIATALEFMKIDKPGEFRLYSYDTAMLDLARQFRVKTNARISG